MSISVVMEGRRVTCVPLGLGTYAHQREGEDRPFEWHGAENIDKDSTELFSDVCSVARAINERKTALP